MTGRAETDWFRRARRSGATLAAGLWAAQFALTTQALLVVAWMPWLARDMGVPFAAGAALISLYAVLLAVGALAGGVLIDFAGPRRVAAAGVFIAATGLSLHAFVDTFAGFAVVRVVTGAGHALLGGALLPLMANRFRFSAGRTFGRVMSGGGAGQTVGVAAGLVLAEHGAGAAVFAGCGGLLALSGWRVFLDAGTAGGAAGTGTPFAWTGELRARLGGLRALSFAWQGCAAQFFMYAGSALLVVFFPAWWTLAAGHGAMGLAAVLFGAGIVQTICTAWGGLLAERFSAPAVVRLSLWVSAGLLLVGSGLQWLPAAWMTAVYLAGVAVMSVRLSPVQVVVSGAVARRDAGSWLGLLTAVGQAGRAGGGALGALMFAPGGLAVVLVAGAVAFFLSEHAFSKAYGKTLR
ncbi:MAG: MFS transporter [Opitutales bacterium]|nr:MFS transporter [Opitutales bacterium]